jgi:predicted metal-dependent hydrolase
MEKQPFPLPLPIEKLVQLIQEKTTQIKSTLEEYQETLQKSQKEEDMQVFLEKYPQLLHPNVTRVYPKEPLGSEYKTDYILLVKSENGDKYILIEIEDPKKNIFTQKGHFSKEYTGAKDQLLNWKHWVRQHISYFKDKFPDMGEPEYHLVMGRNIELTPKKRQKIRAWS